MFADIVRLTDACIIIIILNPPFHFHAKSAKLIPISSHKDYSVLRDRVLLLLSMLSIVRQFALAWSNCRAASVSFSVSYPVLSFLRSCLLLN